MKYKDFDIVFTKPLHNITDLKIKREIGEHSKLYLNAVIPEEESERYALEMDFNDNIQVTQQEKVVFCGYVYTAGVKVINHVHYLELEAIAYTYDFDIVKKYRSFQDLSMTYQDILNEIMSDYPKAEYIDTITKGKVIDDIIVQYNETDWEFMKRLASHFGKGIVCEDKAFYPRLFFGLPEYNDITEVEEKSYIRCKNLEDYIDTVSNFQSSINDWDKISYQIETYQYFNICEVLKYKYQPLVITKIETYIKQEEILHKYYITTKDGAGQNFIENKNIKGARIGGVIKEIQRNTIRIHLDIDPVYKGSNNKFISYAGGINNEVGYYMPKEGSAVLLYFPTTMEKDAIICSSVRKGTAGQDRMSDTREKHMRNEFGKEMRLGHNDMEFKTQGNQMSLGSSGVVTINSGDTITITATTDMEIGHSEKLESGVGWATIEPMITENISFMAGKSIVMETESGGHTINLDDLNITDDAYIKIEQIGTVKKAPAQDYTQEIEQAKEQDAQDLQDIRAKIEETERAKQAEAERLEKEKFWSGLKALAVGVTCVVVGGLAIAGAPFTGGGSIAAGAAVIGGACYAVSGASNMLESNSIRQNITQGDYSGGYNILRDTVFQGNQDAFDIFMYGSGLVSEVSLAFLTGNPQMISSTLSGGALATVGQGVGNMLMGEPFYDLSSAEGWAQMLKGAENGTFSGLLTGGLSKAAGLQNACGLTKPQQWFAQQGIDTAVSAVSELTTTGDIDWEALLISQAVGGAGSALGMKYNNRFAQYALDVAGDTLGQTGVTLYRNDWDFNHFTEDDWRQIQNRLIQSAITNTAQSISRGEPVDTVRGLLTETFTDIVIPDVGFDLEIVRYYNSKNHRTSCIGKGWIMNIDSRVMHNDRFMMIQMPDSSIEVFEKQCDVWTSAKEGSLRNKIQEDSETGFITMLTFDKKKYVYNQRGNLISITDSNQNTLSIQYIDNTEVIDNIQTTGGKRLKFEYHDNKISSITDHIGRTMHYYYEGELLTKVEDRNHGITTYTYNENGYMDSITDANGKTYVENKFDKKGRVIWQKFNESQEVFVTYDEKEKVNTFYYTADDASEQFYYNNKLLVTKVVKQDGSTEEYDYDKWENKIFIKDGNGNITKRIYDENANIVLLENPDGTKENWKYNESGFVIQHTKANGQNIFTEYDKNNNVTKQKEQLQDQYYAVTTYKRDSKGRVTEVKDANGFVTKYVYKSEQYHLPTQIINEHHTIDMEYDDVGRKISQTIEGCTENYYYNNNDSLVKQEDGEGNTTITLYNKMDEPVKKFLPNEYQSGKPQKCYEYIYDSFDRVIKTITPEGSVFALKRDNWGRVRKEINPNCYDENSDNGEGVCYEYDAVGNQIKTIYPDGGVLRSFYDNNKNKIKEIKPENYKAETDDGVATEYIYDSMNRLTTVMDEKGIVVKKMIYNEMGLIVKEMDAKGYQSGKTDEQRYGTLYEYDKAGRLIEKRIPKTINENEVYYSVFYYEYDALGNLIQEKRSKEYVTENQKPVFCHQFYYTYNVMNQLTKATDTTGACVEYAYDKRGNCISEKQKINDTKYKITKYQYDKANRLIKQTEIIDEQDCYDAQEQVKSVTSYIYDSNGNVIQTIYPNGKKVLQEYDHTDRLIKNITLENGKKKRENSFVYDKSKNVVCITDIDGNTQKVVYDLLDRPISITNKENETTKIQYTLNGKVKKQILPEQIDTEKGTTYIYDEKDRLLSVVNALGITEKSYQYDINDNVTEQINGVKNAVKYQYDIANRRVTVLTAEKSSQQYEYDALDNVVKTIDGNKNQTSYITDAWGRVAETIKADGSREKFDYDYAGNVTATTDGNGNIIQYQYNSLNKLSKIIDQQGMEEIMLYDISGNLYYKKDRNGNELKYTYDTDDNLINVSNASRQSKGRNRFIQPDFSESYEYNADGTLKKAISKGILYTYQYDKQGRQIEKWQNGKMVLQYAYDKNGNMVCQKDITGKQTAYTFDDVGRIQTVIDDGEKAVQYYYNDDSTLQKICYGNGITTEYSYNKDQSVVSLMTAKKDGTLITQNTYAYDENGNQIQKTEKGIKTTYAYDSLNQIKTVVYDEKVTELFDYDAVGNRVKRTLQGKEENYYYNNKNQLLQIDKENDTIFYKYDNQGNTLEQTSSKGTTTYQYDIYNRTRRVTIENGDIIKNKYDPLGFRYKKEVNGETHNYIFDGWSITAETNKDGELKSREVRGYGLVKKEIDNNQYYYHQNEHGDITHLTNIDEEIENSYQYDVFGNIREQQENVENVFKYAGEQQDQETQQYYLRARFYNPVIARFTQEDVYRSDGLNLYVYVVNNPLLWIDPSGYATTKCNQNIYGLDPSDIPSVRDGKFNRFFNSLTPDELDDLWKDERIKKTISSRLRQPGKLHEWHMVAATPQFKRWGLTAERIKETRTLIKDVEFINPGGKHGQNGSTTAHNEILDIINSSIDYDMFVRRLNTWADYRLKDGRNSLPQGLRY